jgi:hypothetical protein
MARHRTQLSLDEEHYQALADLAQSRQSTIPEVARELIDLGLRRVQGHKERGKKALADLSSLRRTLEVRIGISSSDPVAESRATRERKQDEILGLPERR